MSLDIGSLVAYIKVDHSGVGKGITAAQAEMRRGMDRVAGDAKVGGTKAGKSAGDSMSGAFKGGMGKMSATAKAEGAKAGKAAGDSMTSSFKGGVSKLVGIAAGAFAVEKIVGGLRATKDAASDLNETSSMSGVIWGKNKAAAEAFAKTGPEALGLSTEATLRYTASLGDMLLQLGFSEAATLKLSKATIQQAADLGSFKNLDTSDVLDRINASLRGEYDSLQALIPNINAARVEKEAMAATGVKVATQLTAEQKATATLAIIQKDGARASGDFARTKDSEANASKTAAAAAEDLKAKIGQGLLPAYTALVVFGRDQVIPFLGQAVDYMGAAADSAKPLADGVGSIVDQFRQMPAPVQAATLGLIAMVALRSRVDALGTSLQGKVTGGAKAAGGAIDALKLHMMYAGDAASGASNKFTAAGKAIGYSAGVGIRGAASGLLGVLGGPWGAAFIGATTILTLWLNKQADAKQKADAFRDSIDQQTGAITEQSRALRAKSLQEDGTLDRARKLGLSIKTVTDAASGNTDALKELQRAQDAASEAGERGSLTNGRFDTSLQGSLGTLGAFGDEQHRSADASKIQGDSLASLLGVITPMHDESVALSGATKEVAEAAGAGATAQDSLGDSIKPTTEKITDQKDENKKLAESILAVTEANIAAAGGQIAYEASLDKVDERLAKRKELEAELKKAGGKSDRTENLEEKLAGTKDPKKRAKIESDLAKSRSKDLKKNSEEIARLREELAEYAGGLDITTKAGQENKQMLLDQATAAKGVAEKNLEAGDSLESLRGFMATARSDFIENAMRLGASKTEAEKMATEFGLTKGTVDNLAKSVEGLPASKQILIEAETAAAEARLAAVWTALASIKSKSVVITATQRFVNNGAQTNGSRATGGGLTFDSADGNIYKFADGAHVAKKYLPKDGIRVFNEPETDGETYIPHSMAKRQRSIGILGQTADEFGFDLVPKSVNNKTENSANFHIGAVHTASWDDLERQAKAKERLKNLGRRRAQ